MSDVEERIRAATRAVDGAVREVRPLRLPPSGSGSRARRARRARWPKAWVAPVTAAAAVLAIGIALVLVRDIPNGRVVPPVSSASSSPSSTPRPTGSDAVPEYYVALTGTGNALYAATVGATFTGARVATVNPPAGSTFAGVTGAADDRTFVLDATSCERHAAGSRLCPRTWYLLRLYPGAASPARLTRLRIPATVQGTLVQAMALCPDGSELALALQSGAAESLTIYSVATGAALRTWTGPAGAIQNPEAQNGLDPNSALFWTKGSAALTFRSVQTVRTLETSGQGHDLIADSRLIWSYPGTGKVPGYQLTCENTPIAVGDGATLACGATGMPQPVNRVPSKCSSMWNNAMGFLAYSAATGHLTRALYVDQTTCTSEVTAEVLWASPSGGTLIGLLNSAQEANPAGPQWTEAGIVSKGTFRPLTFPAGLAAPLPDSVAW
jgi:hypothetical protein